jgi:heme oxygenase
MTDADTTLYELTTAAHHDAEQNPFGKLYATGEVKPAAYADWLVVNAHMHHYIDDFVPECVRRLPSLTMDLLELGKRGVVPSGKVLSPVPDSTDIEWVMGTAYIFCGAHLRGGAMIRPKLELAGLPCHHLHFEFPREAREWLRELRQFTHLAPFANDMFGFVNAAMTEIYKVHYPDADETDGSAA